MSQVLKRTVEVLLAIQVIALIALVATGGFTIDIAGLRVSMNSLPGPIVVVAVLAAVRLMLAAGLGGSILIVVSTAFTLGVGEIGFRILDPPLAGPALLQIHRPSEVYGHALLPGSAGYGTLGEWIEIDADGRRRGLRPGGPRARIAVLGDSFTFGMGVAYENSYVGQLQAALPDVTVLNFGVIGYHLWQLEALMRQDEAVASADLVILGLFIDDVSAPTRPADVVASNPFVSHREDEFTGSKVLNAARNVLAILEARNRSHRGADFLASIDKRKAFIGPDNADHVYYRIQKGLLEDEVYDEVDATLARMDRWAKARNIPLLSVIIPDASQLGEPDRQHVNRFLGRVFEARQMAYVDTTPAFEAVDDPRPLFLFPIDAHTSRDGHALIAEAILGQPEIAPFRVDTPAISRR